MRREGIRVDSFRVESGVDVVVSLFNGARGFVPEVFSYVPDVGPALSGATEHAIRVSGSEVSVVRSRDGLEVEFALGSLSGSFLRAVESAESEIRLSLATSSRITRRR